MTREEQKQRVLEYYHAQICVLKALGMDFEAIGEYLYKTNQISCLERNYFREENIKC